MAASMRRCLLLTWLLSICFQAAAADIPLVQSVLDRLSFGSTRNGIRQELGPKLSDAARLITPDSADFRASILRWQEVKPPSFRASVEAATERDIQETILYANAHNIPFLATTGKHGDMVTLSSLRDGIQIDMQAFNKVEVLSDGKHAVIGGGIKQGNLVSALTAANKRTVTGVCDCVGLGLALGSGHGFLQGQYGLMADQIVEWRLVLANGTAITVTKDSHPDLFWALNGAGHNYGIVTEIKMKVYDLGVHDQWVAESYIFAEEQLEDIYAAANELFKTQPPEDVHLSYWMLDPAGDGDKWVISYMILHDSPLEAVEKRLATPLRNLGPLATEVKTIAYTDLPKTFYSSKDDPACAKAVASLLRFPLDFNTYNTTTMRQLYDLTTQAIKAEPAFSPTMIAIEGYPVQGVQAIDAASSAFPWRSDTLLISPFLTYAPNPALDAKAVAFGEAFRSILHEGTGRSADDLHAYINYARGDEGMGAWYGHEAWRLEKLRRLKSEFDPLERFSWFAPIELGQPAEKGGGRSEL